MCQILVGCTPKSSDTLFLYYCAQIWEQKKKVFIFAVEIQHDCIIRGESIIFRQRFVGRFVRRLFLEGFNVLIFFCLVLFL